MKNLNPYGLSLCLISLICWSSLLVYFNRDKLISEEEQRPNDVLMMNIEEPTDNEMDSIELTEEA